MFSGKLVNNLLKARGVVCGRVSTDVYILVLCVGSTLGKAAVVRSFTNSITTTYPQEFYVKTPLLIDRFSPLSTVPITTNVMKGLN